MWLNRNKNRLPVENLETPIKQLAKGGSIGIIGNSVGKVIRFLFQILLGRVLGASTYGIYALGSSILGIATQISSLGLSGGVVKFAAIYGGEGNKRRLKGTLIAATFIALISGLLCGIALFLWAKPIAMQFFGKARLVYFLKIVAFSLPFSIFINMAASSAQAQRRIEYAVGLTDILWPATKLVVTSGMFLLGFKLLGVAYGLLIAGGISALVGFYFMRKLYPELTSTIPPIYEIRKLMVFSAGVLFIQFSQLGLSQTDRIMLGYLSTLKNVGIYNAALVIATQTAIFLSAFNFIFAPIIADLYNRKEIDQLSELFKITTKWTVILTLPVFLGLLFFATPIMGLFGPEFKNGWLVLSILASAQLVNAGVGGVGYILVMTGHQWLEAGNSIVLGGINILLNFWLIQRYGALGAAVATGLSLAAINLARLGEVYWLLGIHPYKVEFLKPLGAGLIAVGVGILFRYYGIMRTSWMWLVGLVGMVIIYVIMIIIMGLDPEDKIVWQAIKRRLMKL